MAYYGKTSLGNFTRGINALNSPSPIQESIQNQLNQSINQMYQSNIAAFTSSYPKAYSGFASGMIAASDLVFNEGEKKEESLKDYMKRKLVWEDSTG